MDGWGGIGKLGGGHKMRIGGDVPTTGNPGGGHIRVGDIVVSVNLSDSCCRACRLTSAMGTSGLA